MKHKKIRTLPEKVKKALPEGAQKIYLEAYNAAWDQYAKPSNRRPGTTQAETASRVAWHAVRSKYEKNSKGKWVRK